jgi:hypothetical protein
MGKHGCGGGERTGIMMVYGSGVGAGGWTLLVLAAALLVTLLVVVIARGGRR